MSELDRTSRLWLRDVLSISDMRVLENATSADAAGARLGMTPELLEILGPDGPVAKALTPHLPGAFPTRLLYFDKNDSKNWGVPWHQDKVIAVGAKTPCDGFGNWSQKSSVWHCEPPEDILKNMLFLRLHLDDETEASGPMQIACGSHREGLIPTARAKSAALGYPVETCVAQKGDILVLKMLTLHRSSAATKATSRRVLRVDYANRVLPEPLRWNSFGL